MPIRRPLQTLIVPAKQSKKKLIVRFFATVRVSIAKQRTAAAEERFRRRSRTLAVVQAVNDDRISVRQ